MGRPAMGQAQGCQEDRQVVEKTRIGDILPVYAYICCLCGQTHFSELERPYPVEVIRDAKRPSERELLCPSCYEVVNPASPRCMSNKNSVQE